MQFRVYEDSLISQFFNLHRIKFYPSMIQPIDLSAVSLYIENNYKTTRCPDKNLIYLQQTLINTKKGKS